MTRDVTRGLIGRRVCGGIEIAFAVVLLLVGYTSVERLHILLALFIILTGSLGIASNKMGLVIAYMVTGIICAILLAIVTIFLVKILVAFNDIDAATLDSSGTRLDGFIAATVIIEFLAFLVTILGIFFAGLPLCGNMQDEQFAVNYARLKSTDEPTSGISAPPSYDHTTYSDAKQGPV